MYILDIEKCDLLPCLEIALCAVEDDGSVFCSCPEGFKGDGLTFCVGSFHFVRQSILLIASLGKRSIS